MAPVVEYGPGNQRNLQPDEQVMLYNNKGQYIGKVTVNSAATGFDFYCEQDGTVKYDPRRGKTESVAIGTMRYVATNN